MEKGVRHPGLIHSTMGQSLVPTSHCNTRPAMELSLVGCGMVPCRSKKFEACQFAPNSTSNVAGNFFFLGGTDYLMGRDRVVGAMNNNCITIRRCSAVKEVVKQKFNYSSCFTAKGLGALGEAVVLADPEAVGSSLFAGPLVMIAIMATIVPSF
eukprot:scaffold8501_cov165-Amphora_coffeaeformis.AAC.5